MAIDDTESCSNGRMDSSPKNPRQQRRKMEVYSEVLRRLKDSDNEEVNLPGFDDELWAHFDRLPTRYALDVNVERVEDVLMHKRLLQLAHGPANRPAFEVRLVQVRGNSKGSGPLGWVSISGLLLPEVLPSSDGNLVDSFLSNSPREDDRCHCGQSILPPPAFGSSSNLKALATEANESCLQDGDSTMNAGPKYPRPMHEITFSADDRPKLLSQLTLLLAEIGLNIQEAHAFSTADGRSLDVFVVEGWPYKETDQLRQVLEKEMLKIENKSLSGPHLLSSISMNEQCGAKYDPDHVKIPTDGTDDWEIDVRMLKFDKKVASGSYGDLYRGSYRSQEVAIKVLKPEHVNADMQQEFAQEVYIMRKVRHKNVVQFIGACTEPPGLCIVTEFMSGGSVYDFLHKQKGFFKFPTLLKVAIDISKGMNYLHQNNIIHRDLKAANLLMDENEVVKVADFGVARVKAQSGVMTAETGTYRWMAPEVIEHKPYDHKADVFSFGVVLWELLTGKLPYGYLTPLQAAIGVVQKGLRPSIPKHTHPKLVEVLEKCWHQDPTLRPDFSEIKEILQQIAKEVADDGEHRRKEKSGRFLSVLRRGHH